MHEIQDTRNTPGRNTTSNCMQNMKSMRNVFAYKSQNVQKIKKDASKKYNVDKNT